MTSLADTMTVTDAQPMPPVNQHDRFAHVDALRAFAVLLVVVAHCGLETVVPGGSGVTIFFAISGFIITYVLLRERDRTRRFSMMGFYVRRALKLGPPMVLVIVVPTLLYSIGHPLDWMPFLSQVFFTFNWVRAPGQDILPGSGVVWSLAIEEQFYLIFALVWMLVVRSRHWRVMVAAIASIAVVASTTTRFILAVEPGMTDRIFLGSDTRIDGIGWGVLAALVFHKWQTSGIRSSRWRAWLGSDAALGVSILLFLASVALPSAYFHNTIRYSMQSIAACVVLLYGFIWVDTPIKRLFLRISKNRSVSTVGLASYSIYLVHLPLRYAFDSVTPGLPGPIAILFRTTLGILAGVLIWRLVEQPVQRAAHRRRNVVDRTVAT